MEKKGGALNLWAMTEEIQPGRTSMVIVVVSGQKFPFFAAVRQSQRRIGHRKRRGGKMSGGDRRGGALFWGLVGGFPTKQNKK